ncbi:MULTISPECIES: hypothetical protein [unclassified Rhodococcus (in: high G+C Gram-positive bacteria)]|uniref:hypothetical protein n=1 Tax=unclassified Rhodococcus (in: high G+C Gram-positive bacteria) TaxID=192944 RepID=UPI001179D74D|nr:MULTISPECIES: hypothetical protein [unclassified Rhodococcus (in: high G+C Gram-positive bacteria)]MBP1160466.1 outer membrane receptor protein involved in Fe transport [Rhodococcus sp. PvR099]
MLTRNTRVSAALLIAGAAAAGALFSAPVAGAATPMGGQIGTDPACGPVVAGPSGTIKIHNAQIPSGLGGIVVRNFFQFPGGTTPSVSLDPGDIKTIIVTTGPAAGGFGIGQVAGSYQLPGAITCVVNVPFVLEP